MDKWITRAFFGLAGIGLLLTLAGCSPAATETIVVQEGAVSTNTAQPSATAAPEMEEAAEDDMDGGAGGPQPPAESDERGGGDPDEPLVDTEFQASLSAGEIDDNEDFAAYMQYRADYERFVGMGNIPDVEVRGRQVIRVVNAQELPVLTAEVFIYAGQELVTRLLTDASGTVYFHPEAYPRDASTYTVSIRHGQAEESFTLDPAQSAEWTVSLNTAPTEAPVNLDIVFLVDTTYSMVDELAQLKDNNLSISAQIRALPAQPNVRYGLVLFRDRGDIYVTRTYEFTDDVDAFQQVLLNVRAEGGGDIPESLNEGLYRAVAEMDWRIEDTVSLLFLVSDAPPQLAYEQDYSYINQMQQAAELGITIHPIASSGLTADGEYFFRQIAQFTGGNFIFLTYEDQPQESTGEPGRDDVSVPEGSFTVEDLDVLVTRLIEEEIAQLFGQ
ncbi:MAG: VWA domain-containing protein [Anaerolineae bacterium]